MLRHRTPDIMLPVTRVFTSLPKPPLSAVCRIPCVDAFSPSAGARHAVRGLCTAADGAVDVPTEVAAFKDSLLLHGGHSAALAMKAMETHPSNVYAHAVAAAVMLYSERPSVMAAAEPILQRGRQLV